jgi:hypothetical protein
MNFDLHLARRQVLESVPIEWLGSEAEPSAAESSTDFEVRVGNGLREPENQARRL